MANYACGFPHVMPVPAASAAAVAFVRFSGVVVCTSHAHALLFPLKFTCAKAGRMHTVVPHFPLLHQFQRHTHTHAQPLCGALCVLLLLHFDLKTLNLHSIQWFCNFCLCSGSWKSLPFESAAYYAAWSFSRKHKIAICIHFARCRRVCCEMYGIKWISAFSVAARSHTKYLLLFMNYYYSSHRHRVEQLTSAFAANLCSKPNIKYMTILISSIGPCCRLLRLLIFVLCATLPRNSWRGQSSRHPKWLCNFSC